MRPTLFGFSFGALALFAIGCAGSTPTDAVGGSDALTTPRPLVFSPVDDPALTLAVELVAGSDPATGPRNTQVTLTRGGDKQVVPCDNLSAGGNVGDAEQLWCELQQGREENEVHERFVLAIKHTKTNGVDAYSLTQALHDQEGTDWVPMIDVLFPAWRTKPFTPEKLKIVSAGSAAKNPFAFTRELEDLLAAASVGLTLPNVPSKIGTAPGVHAPTAPGPFSVTNPGLAVWGDYGTSFVFTIGQGVWFNVTDVSVFVTPKDPSSGLLSADVLRERILTGSGSS
jgi:hypothetical protein